MRTRSEGNATLGGATYREMRSSSNNGSTWGAWTRTDYPAGTIGEFTRTTTDEVTAGYQTLLKQKRMIPHTTFHQVESSYLWSLGSHQGVYKTTGTNRTEFRWPNGIYGNISSVGVIPGPVDIASHIDYAAAEGALQKATAEVSSVGIDGLTFAAELMQLRKLFNQLVVRIFQLVYRWREYREILFSIPGVWLEARFGLRPLVSDLEAIIERTSNLNRMQAMLYKHHTTTSGVLEIPDTEVVTTSGDIKATVKSKYSTSCSYRGSAAALIRNGGFGFNPIATAWELVPFSFVVDWFLSVGNSILSAQTIFLSKELTSSMGWLISVEEQHTKTLGPGGGGTYITLNSTTVLERSTVLTQRTPAQASIIPQIRYNMDAFKGIDALALLFQALQGVGYVPRR